PPAFIPFDSWRKCLIASVTIRAHEPRPNFPRRTDCCLALDPSNRHLPQAQVTSDVRKTRSMAGGSVHFGDVTACGHCSLAGADRLGDRSRLDGLVLGVPSNLVARFWDSYRAYMERTGRFLPRIRTTLRGA